MLSRSNAPQPPSRFCIASIQCASPLRWPPAMSSSTSAWRRASGMRGRGCFRDQSQVRRQRVSTCRAWCGTIPASAITTIAVSSTSG